MENALRKREICTMSNLMSFTLWNEQSEAIVLSMSEIEESATSSGHVLVVPQLSLIVSFYLLLVSL